MPELIELLECFNRKERYFLIKQALGEFRLSDKFREDLEDATSLAIPHDAFAAMDYHLEWLTAALYAHKHGDVCRIFDNPRKQLVKGNQEDIDLLVAFKDGDQYHVVLVEAKGATSWTNKQMLSKACRLAQIFGCDGNRHPGVMPHFSLASPSRPKQLRTHKWPGWMSKEDGSCIWLELNFPGDRLRVTRCDADGNQSAKGEHFRIKRVSRAERP